MSPLSKDETGRGCSPVHSCGVVIMDLLVDRCCFSFSIDSLWFPARRCNISGTLVVPLVVFVVQKIIGLNSNSLYLYAIQQENPTGYFVRYKESENFKPDPCSKFGLLAYQWLSWISHKKKKFIQHKFNKGEKRITDQSIEVDGFIEETNEVLQFDGCFFHSCDLCSMNRNPDGSLEEFHPLNGKKHEDIRKATLQNTKKLQDAGFSVRRIRGCEWNKMKQEPQVKAFIKTLKAVEPRYQ